MTTLALSLHSRTEQAALGLARAMKAPGDDLAAPALAICALEYPSLDPTRYVQELDRMGADVSRRIRGGTAGIPEEAVRAINEYLYDEQGFHGNREQYDDPRNSCLNEVIDRRTGIPISLAVVYIEVARRAGVRVDGVNFPGHFLLRVPACGSLAASSGEFFIVDPFHGGAILNETDCRQLLRQHVGDEATFDAGLLAPATRQQIVTRMLVNLKRLYVRMRSFPQARFVSDLLLAVDPAAISELRDRGLLAYHLQDFAAALRDLESYLRLLPRRLPSSDESTDPAMTGSRDTSPDDEHGQIWEHVKTLRKRVAEFN